MDQKRIDELQKELNHDIKNVLLNAALMGSAASAAPGANNHEKTGATDTLVAVSQQLAARLEALIRAGYTLAGALDAAQSEGWANKVLPHVLAAVECKL